MGGWKAKPEQTGTLKAYNCSMIKQKIEEKKEDS
jgi:hypothetical protein